MADGISITVDSAALIALLGRMGPSADLVVRQEGLVTAKRIVAEAKGRIRRATSALATGVTQSEIHFELTRDGKGYVVLGYDTRVNKTFVEKYLEKGTRYMYARPFFWSSAELESGPHLRRLEARISEWLATVGR